MEKEDILFAMLKDKVVMPSGELKKRYPNVNIFDLRLRIINYQVMKYGAQLDQNVDYATKQEVDKAKENAKRRKRYWRNKI